LQSPIYCTRESYKSSQFKKITISLPGGIPSNPDQNQGTFLKYIGELWEDTLVRGFTEKFGSGGGRRRRSSAGGAREERGGGGREERRIDEKEEGRRRPNRYAHKGASLTGALLANVAWTRVHMELPTYGVSLDGALIWVKKFY
jgi:hypothetical protein